jgi:hypothetical protein
MLIELSGPGNFWISDHPVILHNDAPAEFVSKNGLGVLGVQIYLPISPSHAIAFFCQSLIQELEEGLKRIDENKSKFFANCLTQGNLGEAANLTLADMKLQRARAERILVAMRDDRKIKFNKQNLIFLNSKQVISAHRFVASRENKFSLAVDMLKQHPDLKEPSHVSFG